MFLVWGLFADEVLNLVAVHLEKESELPGVTWVTLRTFPLNNHVFSANVSLAFCGGMMIILLLTFSTKPILAPTRFLECTAIAILLFWVSLGFYLLALVLPFHLLMIEERPMTILNYVLEGVTTATWMIVAGLLIRMILIWRK
jgi:hypothetical protein